MEATIQKSAVDSVYTNRFRQGYKQTTHGIIIMAIVVSEVRDKYGYSEMVNWLTSEFDLHASTGEKLLNVQKNVVATLQCKVNDDDAFYENVGPSALYLLAAPSTPAEIREEFIEQAKAGEAVTHKEVKAAIDETKPESAKPETSKPTPARASYSTNSPESNGNGRHPTMRHERPAPPVKEPEPPEPEKPPICDCNGTVITNPEIMDVFTDAGKFDEARNLLKKVAAIIKELAGDQGENNGRQAGACLHEKLQTVRTDYKNLWEAIKWARPFALCPYPHSRTKGYVCNACNNRGWVTKSTYDQAPAEMKAVE